MVHRFIIIIIKTLLMYRLILITRCAKQFWPASGSWLEFSPITVQIECGKSWVIKFEMEAK